MMRDHMVDLLFLKQPSPWALNKFFPSNTRMPAQQMLILDKKWRNVRLIYNYLCFLKNRRLYANDYF